MDINIDLEKYKTIFIDNSVEYSSKIILAFFILWFGFRVIKVLRKIFHKLLVKQKIDIAVRSFLDSLISIVLKI